MIQRGHYHAEYLEAHLADSITLHYAVVTITVGTQQGGSGQPTAPFYVSVFFTGRVGLISRTSLAGQEDLIKTVCVVVLVWDLGLGKHTEERDLQKLNQCCSWLWKRPCAPVSTANMGPLNAKPAQW